MKESGYDYVTSRTPRELLHTGAWKAPVDEAQIARRERKARRGDIVMKMALWSWLALVAGGLTAGIATAGHPHVAIIFVGLVVGLLGIAVLAVVGVVLFVLGGGA